MTLDYNVIWNGLSKLLQFIEGNMNVCNFIAIHPILVESFNSKSQMSTSWWH